jgi:hypothetical protein
MYNGVRFLASDSGFKEMMHDMQNMEMMSMDHFGHNM